jgi:hypothetical protein
MGEPVQQRARQPLGAERFGPFIATLLELDVMKTKTWSHVTALTAVDRGQYQLGFLGVGGHTGFAGTKPSRLGIWIFGKLLASRTSLSWMMPFW